MKKSPIFIVLATNILTFLTTVFLDNSGVIAGSFSNYAHLFWLIPTGALLAIWLTSAASELAARTKAFERISRLSGSVPTFCVIEDRQDTFKIRRDGACEIEYRLRMRIEGEDVPNYVNFPILCNLNEDGSHKTAMVDVQELSVNGTSRLADDKYSLARRVFFENNTNHPLPMAFGHLKIPFNGDEKRAIHEVYIKLILPDSFERISQSDYFLVDVPYLTHSLSAEISVEDGRIEGVTETPGGRLPVEAVSEFTDMYIVAESRRASMQISQLSNKSLRWRSQKPKLGFRYKVWFRAQFNES